MEVKKYGSTEAWAHGSVGGEIYYSPHLVHLSGRPAWTTKKKKKKQKKKQNQVHTGQGLVLGPSVG